MSSASAKCESSLLTTSLGDMPKLVRGLQILNQADPCAEYLVQETGEHVILTAGELHLEVSILTGRPFDLPHRAEVPQRCLKDLRERFAKCAIQQSETIVPFRETAVRAPDMAPPKTKGAARGTVHGTLLDGLVSFTIRAVPIPSAITDFLLAHPTSIASLISQRGSTADESEEAAREERETAESAVTEARVLSPQEFWAELESICANCGGEWVGAADRVWCFGPKRMGANLLLDPVGKTSLRWVRSIPRSSRLGAIGVDQ